MSLLSFFLCSTTLPFVAIMNAYEMQFRSCDTECLFLPFFLRCSQVLGLELHTEKSASLNTGKPLSWQ